MTTDDDTDLEILGGRLLLAPPGTPDPGGGDTDIANLGHLDALEPRGVQDPGGGDTDFKDLGRRIPLFPPGPIPLTGSGTVVIYPAFSALAPTGPLPRLLLDPPESQVLSGVDLTVPQDVEILAAVAHADPAPTFVPALERNPTGAMHLPAIDETNDLVVEGVVTDLNPGGVNPIPALDETQELEVGGPTFSFAPTGKAAEDSPEVEEGGRRLQFAPTGITGDDTTEVELEGPRLARDAAGSYGGFVIDQTTTVEIMGRVINIG